MAEPPAPNLDTNADPDDGSGPELSVMVARAPRRPDEAAAGSAEWVAIALDDLEPQARQALDDDTLLRAGSMLLEHGRVESAAGCFAALEGRETASGLARLGRAWVAWARGEAEACADDLRAASELDPSLHMLGEGATLRHVRGRAGALVTLAAEGEDGEHDVERVSLGRPLLATERATLAEAATRLTGLDAAAVAGYRGLHLEPTGARIERDPQPGPTLTASPAWSDQPRALDDALTVVGPLAEGLAAAHARDVVHGDVRAELVTMAPAGPVLRGTALAGLVPPTRDAMARGVAAPERAAGGAPTAKSDAYGLAALLYRLLTGRDPAGAVLRPSALGLDARLDDLVERGLHPDADARLDVLALRERAEVIAADDPKVVLDAAAPQAVATAVSVPIAVPDDPDDLDAWIEILARKPKHREALDAVTRIEGQARDAERWDRLAEILEFRAGHAEVQQQRVELRRELARTYETRLDAPASAFREVQTLIEEVPVEQQLPLVDELRRLAALTGQWGPLAESLEIVAGRAPAPSDQARLYADLGEIFAGQLGATDRAVAAYEKAVEIEASRAALSALVPLYRKSGQMAELVGTLLNRADHEEGADKAQTLCEAAAVLRDDLDDAAGALATLQAALEAEPGHAESLAGLRQIGRAEGAPDADRVAAWTSLHAHWTAEDTADADGALEALEALSALQPDDPERRDALLAAYLAREQFDKAGPLIRAQVDDDTIDPKRKAALLWKGGRLREQIGKVDGAIEAIEEAVALDPELYDAWLALRDLYRRGDKPLQAIEAQVGAARAHPSRSERAALIFDAATTYLDTLGQPDRGLALLEELTELDPDHREGTRMLVERRVAAGELASAWPAAQRWVAQVSAQASDDKAANLRALSIAGRCALAVEQPERAREYLEKARGFDATNLDVLRLLGEIDMDAERWEDALRSYQAVALGAVDALPPAELAQVYLRMADARSGMGERAKSVELIERALDVDPECVAAVEMLVSRAEGPAESVAAKLRQVEMMARREARLEGAERAALQAERVALLQRIAQTQAEELSAPEDAARTLETILALEPEDPAVLHGLMDAFTAAGRWRDVTRVIERLGAQQTTGVMRAKYLYAGAAIFRDQLDDPESFERWIGRALEADPTHDKAQRSLVEHLEKKGSWKDLAKQLRGQLKSLPKDATAAQRVELFTRLGDVYAEHLDDAKTALAAFSQAVRFVPDDDPGLRARRVRIMDLALTLGDDELDKAIIQGHALIASDPMEFETHHRVIELYQRRGNEDRAAVIARTLAFLKQATDAERALAEAGAEREAQIRSVVTREQWRKALYHPHQDARLTEIFAIVWPIVAAREGHTHAHHSVTRDERAKLSLKSTDHLARYLSYAAGVYDVPAPDYFPRPEQPGGLRIDALCEGEGDATRVFPTILAGQDTLREDSEAGLKFRAAGAISRVRPGHILASVLPSAVSLRHVFYGAASLAGVEAPSDSQAEAERLAKHLGRFMTPAQVDQLGALCRKVLDRGEPDVKRWARGVAYTASRTGFVLCDSIDASARVLTQQGDEGMLVPCKDRIRDLVAYSCSTSYLKLRQELGLSD